MANEAPSAWWRRQLALAFYCLSHVAKSWAACSPANTTPQTRKPVILCSYAHSKCLSFVERVCWSLWMTSCTGPCARRKDSETVFVLQGFLALKAILDLQPGISMQFLSVVLAQWTKPKCSLVPRPPPPKCLQSLWIYKVLLTWLSKIKCFCC